MSKSDHPNLGEDRTRAAASKVLSGTDIKGVIARILPFLGPAFIAAVAYVDPGNFATNIQGGAQYGYMLLWVIFASNLMAILIQMLSAKLGIATGKNLAELCRDNFRMPFVWMMWVIAEVAAIATDLAEFLGAAVGFQLLFHVPLLIGGILTAISTVIILSLEKRGFRPMEAVIGALVGIIAVCYLLETILARPNWKLIAYFSVVPKFQGTDSVLVAAGILGATVMPHVIFLHSALTQGRIVTKDPVKLKKLVRFEMVDILIAMGLAGFVNAAMLIMAAATFHNPTYNNIGTIEQAYRTLAPLLGKSASVIFGVSLLASGLSSSAVGTMAGQLVMQGFLKHSIPIWVRRLVTMIPSLIVIAMGLEPTKVLVISQVILSFGIPFALLPLVIFTNKHELMGDLANSTLTRIMAYVVTFLIIGLNVFLLYQTFVLG